MSPLSPVPASKLPTLDVTETFAGKNILIIGSTGFVGKVALSMLLYRYPNIGRVYVLVRPGAGATPEDRFFHKVAKSPAFDPLRQRWGDGYLDFLRDKVVPIAGDVGRPVCNFTDEDFARFEKDGGLDVVINSAGLVTFTPSLESAVRINAVGAVSALDAARRAGAGLVHVSTCYVAGRRDGEVWEDEPVVGYYPRQRPFHGSRSPTTRRRRKCDFVPALLDRDFDAEGELADCQRIIAEVKARANDRVHISEFRERATRALESQGRDPDDEATLRLAVARERKLWVHQQLTQVGVERAEHWGWTNTYTYTKSLGEQLVLAAEDVKVSVVRPAVVESAMHYPFAGWNEGFNTTAPLVYLTLKGHRQIVTGYKTPMDIIPVDMVCAGMLMACAAVMRNEHRAVYQCGSSGVNPVSAQRVSELTGLCIRRHRKQLADDGDNPVENRIRARLEAFTVDAKTFQRTSAPQFKRLADWASKSIDDYLPSWGAPRLSAIAERVKIELDTISEFTGQVTELMELFQPFTYDCDIRFRSDNVSELYARLPAHDQAALPWQPEQIDWRAYWMGTHFEGLKKWVFPVLDDEFGKKPRSIYTYKDLLELFDSTTKLHRHRVAMRLLPQDESADAVAYTYERIRDMAEQAAAALRERGISAGDRVMLMSENRPEWAISYFGVLKTGASNVPLEHQLSLDEVANLGRASGAAALIASARCVRDLGGEDAVREAIAPAQLVGFDDLLDEPSLSPAALAPTRLGEQVASIIYTSGTTGTPKGVMLSHKNLTSMVAKLSSLFRLYRHDGLLSVLPLHHTFEFSTGLLMPLVHGAQITYLEEIDSDSLARALEDGNITGMVGVPALWQLLHRKITKRVSDGGPLVERAFESVVDFNRRLRERAPYGIDLGKVLFYPIHRALGGRLRLLISGGSALPPDTMKGFLGLGFKLYEGYGMTESSPVLTTQRPGEKTIIGSVGRALPGIDVKIDQPNDEGVGEIIAKGPNVMLGYYQNDDATGQVLQGGWLHTGDLGRVDERGNLYIVGRKKEMILGTSGENVYPDELEEIYRDSPYIDELSIVGLPAAGGGETVAALVVPDYESDTELDREAIRERVREHMRVTSHKLPLYKRVRVFHLWDHELPKTSTRKVKRREVVAELERLERAANAGAEAPKSAQAQPKSGESAEWLRDIVARVAQKPVGQARDDARLSDLGYDSLMFTELGVALEAAGVVLPDPGELSAIETVSDLLELAKKHMARAKKAERLRPPSQKAPRRQDDDDHHDDEIRVPPPLVGLGRRALRLGQRGLYERYLETKVTGKVFVPPHGGYIVAANHSSHLDMGLVKHALGESGPALVALAAKDYFFEDPVRRMYFENFTNLVPMERHGSLRESLRLASEVLREGYILLIFPEGTRSETGVMIDFKPSLGYLAMSNKCGILPMYLAGAHDAMPKGAVLPRRGASVGAHIGPYLDYRDLCRMTEGMGRAESYRQVAGRVEGIVRGLCPQSYEWTLGHAGRMTVGQMADAQVIEERP